MNNSNDEVLDVDEDDDYEECEVVTPSRDLASKQSSNEQPASQQPFRQNKDSVDLTTEGDVNMFIEAYRGSI